MTFLVKIWYVQDTYVEIVFTIAEKTFNEKFKIYQKKILRKIQINKKQYKYKSA